MITNRNIDEFITCAIDILENEKEIVKNGKIKKGYSSQISTFGSAISTGSLLSGIAYFSKSGDSSVNRSRLMWIIYEILKNTNRLNPNLQKEIQNEVPELELYYYVKKFTQNKNKTESNFNGPEYSASNGSTMNYGQFYNGKWYGCLLYTSDAADD